MPITIDGRPFNTSDRNRTVFASRVRPFSARYRPAPMPIGSPIAAAMPMRISVPTIALAIPPPGSPTGFGISVKKSSEMALAPSLTRWNRMKMSGSVATTAAVPAPRP